MNHKVRAILLHCLLFSTSAFSQHCDEILSKTFASINSLQTTSFYLTAKERFFNDYKIEKGYYKIRKKPYSIYYKQVVPATYAEVLINENYRTKALVNPNSFPYVSLTLSPYGEKLRERQHHTIYQAGFEYFKTILLFLKRKYAINWSEVCEFSSTAKVNQTECYKISLLNPQYKITEYTVENDITAQELALKLNLCDYKIVELNPQVKTIFKTIPKGTIVYLPSDYAKKIVLYIEKTTYLPIKIEVFDEKGLFEEYLFENIKFNPTFTDKDFNEKNPEYGFK